MSTALMMIFWQFTIFRASSGLDVYYNRLFMRVASRAVKRFKAWEVMKLGNGSGNA